MYDNICFLVAATRNPDLFRSMRQPIHKGFLNLTIGAFGTKALANRITVPPDLIAEISGKRLISLNNSVVPIYYANVTWNFFEQLLVHGSAFFKLPGAIAYLPTHCIKGAREHSN